ncbi:hypothetical protein BpHYR1_009005 [Brachionus plicatilis]|uniref:Uncharacterized protein n=1 Tax=Brachionus plicatilis TaxID=10195 RepID=A0A3M7QDP1_BRAPC|nr:hypothetical protein BpHYR1_009005 [Brachionus plicatilis]
MDFRKTKIFLFNAILSKINKFRNFSLAASTYRTFKIALQIRIYKKLENLIIFRFNHLLKLEMTKISIIKKIGLFSFTN